MRQNQNDVARQAAAHQPPDATPSESPLKEAIRQRAYELHAGRGGAPGDPSEDWHRAEREIRSEREHSNAGPRPGG
jgi:hypothetical protein